MQFAASNEKLTEGLTETLESGDDSIVYTVRPRRADIRARMSPECRPGPWPLNSALRLSTKIFSRVFEILAQGYPYIGPRLRELQIIPHFSSSKVVRQPTTRALGNDAVLQPGSGSGSGEGEDESES